MTQLLPPKFFTGVKKVFGSCSVPLANGSKMQFMIHRISGLEVAADKQLLKAVIALDRLDMEPILRNSGFVDFPIEKRIANIQPESTQCFGAFQASILLGYLKICRDWKNAKDIYLTSIQIPPSCQNNTFTVCALYPIHKLASNHSLADCGRSPMPTFRFLQTLGFD